MRQCKSYKSELLACFPNKRKSERLVCTSSYSLAESARCECRIFAVFVVRASSHRHGFGLAFIRCRGVIIKPVELADPLLQIVEADGQRIDIGEISPNANAKSSIWYRKPKKSC